MGWGLQTPENVSKIQCGWERVQFARILRDIRNPQTFGTPSSEPALCRGKTGKDSVLLTTLWLG